MEPYTQSKFIDMKIIDMIIDTIDMKISHENDITTKF